MKPPSPPTKVSVVVPAYNVAGYIVQCVDSLLSSTGCSIEVIVIDDASTDATAVTILQRFGTDPRVRCLRLDANRGPSHARNIGIREATGDWLAFVDADDWCAPERFAELLQIARRFNADMVSDDNHLIEDGSRAPWATINQVSKWQHESATPVTFERFIASRHIVKPLVNLSFLRSAEVSFNEAFRHSEDFLFFCELLLHGAKWHTTALAMYYYRIRTGSLTNTGEFAHDSIRVIECLLGLSEASGQRRHLELCREVLLQCRREANIREARAAMISLDVMKLGRALALDKSLFRSIVHQEFSLMRLRVRRQWHRLRFG